VDRGFSRQFAQDQKSEDQRERRAFASRFAPIFDPFQGVIQRRGIDGLWGWNAWQQGIAYGKAHLEPVLAFIGSLQFSYSSKNWLLCLPFGTLKKP
jgi:hypothetical protein